MTDETVLTGGSDQTGTADQGTPAPAPAPAEGAAPAPADVTPTPHPRPPEGAPTAATPPRTEPNNPGT